MKKILGLMIAFILTVGLITGGVWAFSTDVATSSGNMLTAGTLDLSPSTSGAGPAGKVTVTAGGNQANGNVTFQKLLPGDSGNITWVLTDNGTLPGTLILPSTVTFASVVRNEVTNSIPGDDPVNGDLGAYVGVKLQRGVGANQASATANSTYILGTAGNYVALSNLATILNAESQTIAASGGNHAVVYQFSWNIANPLQRVSDNFTPPSDSIIQGDSAQIDITFTLNQ